MSVAQWLNYAICLIRRSGDYTGEIWKFNSRTDLLSKVNKGSVTKVGMDFFWRAKDVLQIRIWKAYNEESNFQTKKGEVYAKPWICGILVTYWVYWIFWNLSFHAKMKISKLKAKIKTWRHRAGYLAEQVESSFGTSSSLFGVLSLRSGIEHCRTSLLWCIWENNRRQCNRLSVTSTGGDKDQVPSSHL